MRTNAKENWFRPFHTVLPEDVTRRDIFRTLIRLIVPAAIEYALLQTVNMFDQIQVGTAGAYATNGVGMVNQIKLLFMTGFVAINIGVTALAARAEGQKNRPRVVELFRHGLLLSFLFSAICSVFAWIFAEPILRWIGAPDEQSFAEGLIYFRICIFGFVPAAITSTVTATLRGIGDTKTSLYYNVVANAVNVLLNWILIGGNLGAPALGIAGAAIATVAGLCIAFLLSCAVFLTGRYGLKIEGRSFLQAYSRTEFVDILRIGIPTMIEQFIVRIGLAAFTKIVSTLGTTLYAAHTICINIQHLTFMNGMAFSVAATTMAGQCLGAGRPRLAATYSQYCARICCLFSLLLSATYALLGRYLIAVYNPDPAIIAAGIVPLRLMALLQPLTALQYVYSGAIRGAGDTKRIAWIVILTTFFIRTLVAYGLVIRLGIGLNGAWLAMVADQSLCSLLISLLFYSGKWVHYFDPKKKRNKEEGERQQ